MPKAKEALLVMGTEESGDGGSHSPSQWKELQVMVLDPCVSIFYRIALSKLDSDPICEEM